VQPGDAKVAALRASHAVASAIVRRHAEQLQPFALYLRRFEVEALRDRHQKSNARSQRQPYPGIARDSIADPTRRRMTHVEDIPKLAEGEGQERGGRRRVCTSFIGRI
jgi:hypothetical protein